MKAFILVMVVSASLLAGCAKQRPPSSGATAIAGPPDSPYRMWTTAQLQQRRNDLYYMISNGGQPPQKDEIRAIEGELIRRFRAGDKAAELKPVGPAPSPQPR